MDFLDYETIFAQAWADPANTRYEMRPIDVNSVLAERYEPSERLSRAQLWDVEVRKARRPDLFIPGVVAKKAVRRLGEVTTPSYAPRPSVCGSRVSNTA
ncbi:SRPBCC family protein [Fodinicola feengrottensis]|uniref:hypothetical protein n=1 Tax=Fodinicola feengrottensis TaxID=435914 RepID=UPI0013D5FA0D|nr:hypothetical protein [Fodinicola feengrottensis]